MILLGHLLLHLFRQNHLLLARAIAIAVTIAVTITVTITAPVSVSVPVPISISVAISVTVALPFFLLSFLSLLVPLLSLQVTLSLSLFALLLALSSALISFFLAFEFGLFTLLFFSAALFLSDTPLFLFNSSFFLLQLLSYSVAFGLLCCGVGGIFLVRLGSSFLLFVGDFLTDLGSPGFPNTLFDCADVNQFSDDFLGLVIHSRSLQRAIDESCGLSTVQRQELMGIALDFLLGHLENGLCNLSLVVLMPRKGEISNAQKDREKKIKLQLFCIRWLQTCPKPASVSNRKRLLF